MISYIHSSQFEQFVGISRNYWLQLSMFYSPSPPLILMKRWVSELRTLKTLEMSRAGPCVRYRGSILGSNIAKYYSSPLQTSIGGEPGLFAMSQHIAGVRVGDRGTRAVNEHSRRFTVPGASPYKGLPIKNLLRHYTKRVYKHCNAKIITGHGQTVKLREG